MKTYLKILICFFLLIQISNELTAQTVTDPAVLEPGYTSRKALAGQSAGAINRNVLIQSATSPTNTIGNESRVSAVNAALEDGTCFIPRDNSYTAVPRNDDGSFGPIALPFNYSLYGTVYTRFWINTNGNLTFTGPLGEYNASGFPTTIPMVAAFWGDVDTSPNTSGAIYYKVSGSNVIVTWDGVGYFDGKADKLNTFQIIITNGIDPIIGAGNNTAFFYKDMQWTTGEASDGVDGFGGNPATVGINRGNNVNFVQVGRFNQNSSAYDGPGGNNDGINYLDGKCFNFNVGNTGNVVNIPPSVSGLPAANTITVNVGDTANVALQFIGPEVGQLVTTQVDTRGLCSVTNTVTNGIVSTVTLRITGAACNVGTHTITLRATDNGSPSQTTTVNLTLNVRKLNQSITFGPLPARTFGSPPFTLSATASSGLPVSYSIVSGPATVTGNTVTLTGVGTVVIQAAQAGNGTFNPATSVTQSFNVTGQVKQNQTINFPAITDRTFGDGPIALNATASSGLPVTYSVVSGPATIAGNMLTLTGVGLVTVQAMQAGNNVYNPAPAVQRAFMVNSPTLRTQTITFPDIPDTFFGSSPILLRATASSGLRVFYQVVSGPAVVGGSSLLVTGAGTIVVRATQPGTDAMQPGVEYAPAVPVEQTFIAAKASQVIMFTDIPDKMLGDAPFTIEAIANSDLPVTYSIVSGPATISGNMVTLTGVGRVTVRATQAGDVNYNPATTEIAFTVSDGTVVAGCTLALTTKVVQAEPWYGMWGPFAGAGAIDLTVTGGTAPYTYRWNAGLSTQDISAASPGIYSVTVTDATGCMAMTTVHIGRKNDFLRVVSSHQNVTTAGGNDGAIDISVVGGVVPATFMWSNGATTEDLTGLAAGTYKVIVTDAFGRKATTTVVVSEPGTPLSLSVAHQNVSAAGKMDGAIDLTVVGGMGPYTYKWNAGASSEDLSAVVAGDYAVTVTDAMGAMAMAMVRVEVGRALIMMARKPGSGADIFSPLTPAGLTTYPNPAKERTTINFSLAEAGTYTLDLYDIRGAKVKTMATGQAPQNKALAVEVEVANYAEGVYLIKLITDQGVSSKRLLIKR